MKRPGVWLILALLVAAPFARGPQAQDAPEPFPHDAHAGLFPNCTACHAGVAGGDVARTYTVTQEECARCHGRAELESVNWSPPPRPASNLKFDHDEHMEVPDMECASCHGGGPDRMDVQPLSQAACLDCHEVTEHFASENDCSTCHLPLIRAVDLTSGQIAAFPTPEDHNGAAFIREHGAAASASTAQCAVCHSRDLCESCHLNADRLASVRELGPDDRVHALLAGREGRWPEPLSHDQPDWLTGAHGIAAVSMGETCANCHVQSSCDQCHGVIVPSGRDQLPAAREDGPLGVELLDAYPPQHVPGFDVEHSVTASSRSLDCMACHTQSYCEDCHYAPTRPGFHPPNYLVRHEGDAYARDSNCADCHSQEVFCRSCHLQTGLASVDPRTASYHEAFGGYWLIAHAQAARQDMENCASCHQQNDCLKCHSTTGWGVNPHGPGFDADRLADKSPGMCASCHVTGPR